jgi:hypothetical protein
LDVWQYIGHKKIKWMRTRRVILAWYESFEMEPLRAMFFGEGRKAISFV